MKRSILKFLPIAAAVLLATSCSKDNDSDNSVVNNPTGRDDVHIVSTTSESNAVPFSIKVVTGKSLSKIGYTDNGIVTPAFTTDDVSNGLQMTISNGTTPIGTLTLTNVDGTFDGTLSPEPADGTELTATIVTNEGSTTTTSTVSIIDLMEMCAHTYSGTFNYKTDDNVMLTDDKAYIEIIMSPLQHDIDLKFNDDVTPQNFPMENGSVWIAVDNYTTFTTNFTGKKNCTAGKITTIKRVGFVDLGISGILWADHNIGSTTPEGFGNYYAWGELEPKTSYSASTYKYGDGSELTRFTKYCPTGSTYLATGSSGDELTTLETSDDVAYKTNTKWSMPTKDDFSELEKNSVFKWCTNYNGVVGAIFYKKKSGGNPEYDVNKDTHIFLPAAKYYDGSELDWNSICYYWSSSLYGSSRPDLAYCFYCMTTKADAAASKFRRYGYPVRAVRHGSNYSPDEGQGGGED